MGRVRWVAALVLGCVLAAAAAATGPFLGRVPHRRLPPLRRVLRGDDARLRPPRGGGVGGGVAHWLDAVIGTVAIVVAAVIAAIALYRLALALVRLVRIRFARSGRSYATDPYDPGHESDADAETALRKRVAADLATLSADLENEPDPREAVIACYVRMERELANAGSPRDPTDSPLELVARVLGELHVPEADIRHLTDLFVEARFSPHPVTEEMRTAARRSLSAVADALATA